MTTIAVTGATGRLGRLVIDDLLGRGIAPSDIVATAVRTPAKAADIAAKGVTVRPGDYSSPETLPAAFAGVETLVFVSSSEVGSRIAQHTAVVEAAKAASVRWIIYTSAPKADTSDLALVPEHKATEDLVRGSGIPFTILRNNWYLENYTDRLGQYLSQGVVLGASGDGLIGGASIPDFAAGTAAVVTGEGHQGKIYELGGTPFTLTDLAAAITEVTGTPVTYRNVTVEELAAALRGAGVDEATAALFAGIDGSIARGALDADTGDLARLLGRPTTSLAEALRAAKV